VFLKARKFLYGVSESKKILSLKNQEKSKKLCLNRFMVFLNHCKIILKKSCLEFLEKDIYFR